MAALISLVLQHAVTDLLDVSVLRGSSLLNKCQDTQTRILLITGVQPPLGIRLRPFCCHNILLPSFISIGAVFLLHLRSYWTSPHSNQHPHRLNLRALLIGRQAADSGTDAAKVMRRQLQVLIDRDDDGVRQSGWLTACHFKACLSDFLRLRSVSLWWFACRLFSGLAARHIHRRRLCEQDLCVYFDWIHNRMKEFVFIKENLTFVCCPMKKKLQLHEAFSPV